jgi:methyl-accepting chemotaxis protein
MTTKFKIIVGFGIMIILLGGMAIFGYMKLRDLSGDFVTFNRYARLNTLSSDMGAAASDMLRRSRAFLMTSDPKAMEEALGHTDKFIKLGNSGKEMTRIEWRTKAFESMVQRMVPLRQNLTRVRDDVLNLRKAYNDDARVAYNAMFQSFKEMGRIAHDVNNMEIVYQIDRLWEELTPALISLGRFSSSLAEEDAVSAKGRLDGLQESIQEIAALLTTERGKQLYAALRENYKKLTDSLARMTELADKTQDNVDSMLKTGVELGAYINNEFSVRLDKETQEEAGRTLAANDNAMLAMLIASGAGTIFGVLLALAIILGFVRTLSRMAVFSEAIAGGDFNAGLDIREKGEIGMMAGSLKAIPATLNKMLDEYKRIENEVGHGILTVLGNAGEFRGAFATLINGTNNILTRFRTVVDNIPSPVIMMNSETRLQYMNTVGQELVGSDFRGKFCKQLFDRDDDGTPHDALKKAVQTKQRAAAETQAHPKGVTMDISYTAIPLLDENRELAAVIQLITDLTAIRTQQRAVQVATGQAAEISNRMAAASEELSAQVEQVSRGAEMQRERVESTASAMNEMNSTVLEVARNAGQASEQSENTRRKAEGGAELVNRVVRSINDVNSVAATLQNNMRELGSKVESIGGVMNVISDIADQTNLLALNAAIEAARAGEAGRGFAVVADEVRKLAEKTMTATQEVGGSITAIQQAARKNIKEVGTAAKSVTEATELANSSGSALKEIVSLAAANSSVVASIATAAEEQSATSEEISRAIDEINRVVNETTRGMVQSSSAVQELSGMAQELDRVMEGLK